MSDVALALERSDGVAGSTLRGSVHVPERFRKPGTTVVIRLRYRTEGRGDADEESLETCIYKHDEGVAPAAAVPFAVVLPTKPWSYDGRSIKIRWSVAAVVQSGLDQQGTEIPFVLRSPFEGASGHPHRSPGR